MRGLLLVALLLALPPRAFAAEGQQWTVLHEGAQARLDPSLIQVDLRATEDWPSDYPYAKILSAVLVENWDDAALDQSPKVRYRPFPELYLRIRLKVASAATLEPSRIYPSVRDETSWRHGDPPYWYYTLYLPLRKIHENRLGLTFRSPRYGIFNGVVDYAIKPRRTVISMHQSCENAGIHVREVPKRTFPSFLLVRCDVEDRLVYVKILKPLDQSLAMSDSSKELIDTMEYPVLRLGIPKSGAVSLAKAGTIKLTDGAESETLALYYDPPYLAPRLTGSVGLAPGIARYSEAGPRTSSVTDLALNAKLDLDYKIIRGVLDASLSGYGTLLPISLASGKNAARWFGLDLRLGYILPFDLDHTTFGIMGGADFWFMNTSDPTYGITNLNGPQICFTVNHDPYGELGWSAYFKWAALSQSGFFSDFPVASANREIGVGFKHDVPWFGRLSRRPALGIDYSNLSVLVNQLTVSETAFSLAVTYPVF